MKVYLLVMAIATATTYVAVPIIRHIALVGNALTPVRARDVHSTPIPRLGGGPGGGTGVPARRRR